MAVAAMAKMVLEAVGDKPFRFKNHKHNVIPKRKWGRKTSGKNLAMLSLISNGSAEAEYSEARIPVIKITAPSEITTKRHGFSNRNRRKINGNRTYRNASTDNDHAGAFQTKAMGGTQA